MLDRYLLRYFLAVVDHGSFSRAAAHCHVAQPTLSVGIAKLERELARKLFVRSNQRVELTDAGAQFLAHARRIEREFNNAIRSMGTEKDLKSIRLGVLNSIPGAIIASAIAHPEHRKNLQFELLFANERELASHLAKERIDVALTLVGRGGNRFMEREIVSEGYALAMPLDHALAGEAEIAAEQLAQEVMIVRRHCEALSDTSRFFTERGVRPHFAFRSTNDERVLQMVAAGLGVTVMPRCYRHEGVAQPSLAGFKLRRTIGWVTAAGREELFCEPLPLLQAIESRLRLLDRA